jgi:hypothetical protein
LFLKTFESRYLVSSRKTEFGTNGGGISQQRRKTDERIPSSQQERQIFFRKIAGELFRRNAVEVPGQQLKHVTLPGRREFGARHELEFDSG